MKHQHHGARGAQGGTSGKPRPQGAPSHRKAAARRAAALADARVEAPVRKGNRAAQVDRRDAATRLPAPQPSTERHRWHGTRMHAPTGRGFVRVAQVGVPKWVVGLDALGGELPTVSVAGADRPVLAAATAHLFDGRVVVQVVHDPESGALVAVADPERIARCVVVATCARPEGAWDNRFVSAAEFARAAAAHYAARQYQTEAARLTAPARTLGALYRVEV